MTVVEFIRAQPEAVAASVAAARRLSATWRPAPGTVHLVGSGSSRNALLAAAPAIQAAGWGAVAVHGPARFASDCAAGLIPPGQVVVLSQSGTSVTSVAATEAARRAGLAVLAITAEPSSPLARSGAATLLMPIGPEPIGPKTKGFAASVATLLALAGVAGEPGALLSPLIARGHAVAADLFPLAARADHLLIAGEGAMDGIALEASLKIAEIAGMPTACFPWEEVLHGRLHGMTGSSLCIVIADDERTRIEAVRAQQAMRTRGVAIEILAFADALPAPWRALGALIPFQWLAVLLARSRGMAPETMRYPGLSADLAIKTSIPA